MRAAVALSLALTFALAGCSAANDDPTITGSQSVRRPVVPSDGTAQQSAEGVASPAATGLELADFSRVNRQTIQRNRRLDGRTFIDALVAAGFRRTAMEVTEDRTTIGLAAPSVQFSVLWRGACLLGQYGPESGGYHAMAASPVAGKCLIGKTRRIDW
ncbi:hypothetical protein [Amnibacterium sp.]|uniref:DUF6993 domain-containing protein n=1 Tax=Amnibacterium sp. TaxID=1872496 RepID=UPI0026308223|nr:hypothetical protein [Amnibacterium sp.]MCU1474873.1 hypothetical protein [Amnibacterium sp.]